MTEQKNEKVLFLGSIINQMEEKLENEIYNFEEKRKLAQKQMDQLKNENQKLSETLNNLLKIRDEQNNDLQELKSEYDSILKDLNDIKNFINQRPTQSEKNEWTFSTLTGVASDLLNRIQNEKKKQQELFQKNPLFEFLQNED